VARYLARLRRRAATLHILRAGIAVAGAAAVVFALAALLVGPLGGPLAAGAAWLVLVGVTAAGVATAWRRFAPLRGAGAARLLSAVVPELPSAARSAYELELHPPAHASAEMIQAHARRVQKELRFITPSHVVRWQELAHRVVWLGLGGLVLAGVLLSSERGAAGAYALIHPGERDAEGERVAVAFSTVSARLTYPSYLARDPIEVLDPSVLELPRGTSVEVRAAARIDATAASLRVGDTTIPMERSDDGRYFARFVAREDAQIVLRARQPNHEWVRDATPRTLAVLDDESPAVSLLDPSEDLVVRQLDELLMRWEVTDDVGIATVDLVVRGADGQEQRRRISSHVEGEMPAEDAGHAPLDLAIYTLARGESLTVWIEARDGDVVNGPNMGRSRDLTITLASEATERERRLASLEALLDTAIHTLADRLERRVPEAGEEALNRFEALRVSTEGFMRALREQLDAMRAEGGEETDIGLLREIVSRVRRLLHEERIAHGRTPESLASRERIDARVVTELEDDVLTLDDLLGRARIQDAAEIARELEALRREIHSLLSEVVRTDSPEARRRLLAAIARAQARMRELMARVSRMGTNVPQEFMNRGEMPMGETSDALQSLREAVQRGDLSEAEQLLSDLRSQIDAIARQLGQTEDDFSEARGFGPRERAMANAMEALSGLEEEQQRLSSRGTERRSRAARRALESIGGRDNRIGRQLASDVESVRSSLESVGREHLAGFEQSGYDRVRERLRDTEDALRVGDLGEARANAEAAQRDLSLLSRDLDLSALMFPGHEGETAQDADRARGANDELSTLRRHLDEALPDVASHLDASDRSEMRGDLGDQRQASRAADRLSEELATGPGGTPLSEDASRAVGEAATAMEVAEEALSEGDPLESARAQEEAARRLTELREELEEQQRQQQGGGGGGASSPDFDRPVDIPNADAFEGPMEMRRRLLDAMRGAPPTGYEDAVRRYYEGLLR